MPPRKPRLVKPDEAPSYTNWNEYVQEATEGVTPFRLPLPPPDDAPDGYVPEVAEVPCPDGDQMLAFAAAQRTGNDTAGLIAIFGEDLGVRLLEATAHLPFFVRAKLIADVMKHYGQQVQNLGD